eukprot:PhM_4_TR5562/c0_g1_i3/m.56883
MSTEILLQEDGCENRHYSSNNNNMMVVIVGPHNNEDEESDIDDVISSWYDDVISVLSFVMSSRKMTPCCCPLQLAWLERPSSFFRDRRRRQHIFESMIGVGDRTPCLSFDFFSSKPNVSKSSSKLDLVRYVCRVSGDGDGGNTRIICDTVRNIFFRERKYHTMNDVHSSLSLLLFVLVPTSDEGELTSIVDYFKKEDSDNNNDRGIDAVAAVNAKEELLKRSNNNNNINPLVIVTGALDDIMMIR